MLLNVFFLLLWWFFLQSTVLFFHGCLHKTVNEFINVRFKKKKRKSVFFVCTALKLCRSWSKAGLFSVKAGSAVSRYEAILFTLVESSRLFWDFRRFRGNQRERDKHTEGAEWPLFVLISFIYIYIYVCLYIFKCSFNCVKKLYLCFDNVL